MVPRRYRAVTLIAVVLGVAAAITLAVLHDRPPGNYGLLGGYLWDSGPVRSIEARWRVPTLLGGSDGAQASTWVGAQQAFGYPSAFVQIGTLENTPNDYLAFWSDTAHGFKPQYLGLVLPGDTVVARITSTPSGWRLTLDDLSAKTVDRASSGDGRGMQFALGLWMQEDPTNLVSHAPEPYPTLSTVALEQLLLNDRPPAYGSLYSQWLSPPRGQYLAPTPLAADQFSLQPASVSRVGAEYLKDATPVQTAYDLFLRQAARWTAHTTAAEAGAQAAAFAQAARTQDQLLAAQSWPRDIHAKIAQSIHYQKTLIADLDMVPRLTPTQRPAWLTLLKRDVQTHAEIGRLTRRTLHIPEYVP